jgi:glycosyltransferase involved in cell wall biosynthesis
MNPLVSIVIPAMGDLKYFTHTLQSILSSTFTDFEVVIIDDGIDSKSNQLISRQISILPNFRLLPNSGSGIVDALNTGILNSKGKYIARIDSDDCLVPERIQVQVDFLNKNPKVAVVGTQLQYIDHQGMYSGLSNYPSGRLLKERGDFKRCPIAHPSVMLRRESLREAGNYQSLLKFEGIDYAEDYFLWTRFPDETELWNLDLPLTLYRQHSNQISNFRSHITALASELVRLNLHKQNEIALPIHFEEINGKIVWRLFNLSREKFGILFAAHLFLIFINASNCPTVFRRLSIFFSKITGRAKTIFNY